MTTQKVSKDGVLKYELKFQYGPSVCEFIMNLTPVLETMKQKLPNIKNPDLDMWMKWFPLLLKHRAIFKQTHPKLFPLYHYRTHIL